MMVKSQVAIPPREHFGRTVTMTVAGVAPLAIGKQGPSVVQTSPTGNAGPTSPNFYTSYLTSRWMRPA